eukprot:augustus_masked-scaffold_10-processed-gene-6.55-mRNA-1 protein AED:1.00 eAED:1.00 QI:0/-1/0/0/-1/1/1/0/658
MKIQILHFTALNFFYTVYSQYTEALDLSYGNETRNQLDLYIPSSISFTPPYPLVVFLHGGNWSAGDKSDVTLYNRLNALTSNGLAVASMNYRLSTTNIWEAQLDDLYSALNFLSEDDTITTYGLDVDRFILWGDDAGGYIALMGGLLSEVEVQIKAVISYYAPSDLFQLFSDRLNDDVDGLAVSAEAEEALLGLERTEGNKAEFDAASPLNIINNTGDRVKLFVENFLVVHGTEDPIVSPLQSERFVQALEDQDGARKVVFRQVEDAGHGGVEFDAETLPALIFLSEVLGSQEPNYNLVSDIQYGPPERQNMNIYFPRETPTGLDANPLVLYIHGGSWFRGSNAQVLDYNRANEITGRGFTVAAMNWRYSSTDSWPAQLEDIIDALNFLDANSEEYNLDMEKVAIWGQSSGAHMALMGGLFAEKLTNSHLEISSTVSWFAITALFELVDDFFNDLVPQPDGIVFVPADDPQTGIPTERLLNLSQTEENKQAFDEASPVYTVQTLEKGEKTCDFMLVHGTADPNVSPLQTLRMFKALEEHDETEELIVRLVPDNGHGGPDFFDETIPSLDFITQSFGLGKYDFGNNNDDIEFILTNTTSNDEGEDEDEDNLFENVEFLQFALLLMIVLLVVVTVKLMSKSKAEQEKPTTKNPVYVRDSI